MLNICNRLTVLLVLTLVLPMVSSAVDIKEYFAQDVEQSYDYVFDSKNMVKTRKVVIKSGKFTDYRGQVSQKVDFSTYQDEALKGRTAYYHLFDADSARRYRLEVFQASTGELVRRADFSPPYPSFLYPAHAESGLTFRKCCRC